MREKLKHIIPSFWLTDYIIPVISGIIGAFIGITIASLLGLV